MKLIYRVPEVFIASMQRPDRGGLTEAAWHDALGLAHYWLKGLCEIEITAQDIAPEHLRPVQDPLSYDGQSKLRQLFAHTRAVIDITSLWKGLEAPRDLLVCAHAAPHPVELIYALLQGARPAIALLAAAPPGSGPVEARALVARSDFQQLMAGVRAEIGL